MENKLNREGWLTELARQVEPLFRGLRFRPYRLTCGWPSVNATSRRRKRVGECHGLKSSTGGVHEVFISPLLAEPLEVAGTVCHELAHVVAGIEAAHGREFVQVCRHVGLTKGRPTSVMPGDYLEASLCKITDKLGAYPHKAMKLVPRPVRPASSVGLTCGSCGCRVTISRKWLGEVGPPTCGCGEQMAEPEGG